MQGMANNSVNKTDERTVKLIKLWGDNQTLCFHEARLTWSRNYVTTVNEKAGFLQDCLS